MVTREKLNNLSTAEVLKLALIKLYIIISCTFMFWVLMLLFACFAYSL